MPINIYGENNPDLARFKVDRESIIWRYMDIGKFLDLITRKKLWFRRAIEFRKTDPYEGALTASDLEMLNRILATNDKPSLREIWPSIGTFMDEMPGCSLHYFQLLFLTRLPFIEMNAYTNCLSCWHENPQESDAMWGLYAQRDAGIAIKCSLPR